MDRMSREQEFLNNYLERYLQTDDEWLELDGSSARYWQARLAQTTTVALLPDGRAKWRVRTRIVEQVGDPEGALQLCLGLNWHAIGWSFAYDQEGRTIDALAAICAPPEWDTYLLRLAEKANLSAWMSDVIAERLSEAVGGIPAISQPQRRSGPRVEFGATYYYAEAVRRRPEWVIDPTWYDYLPMGEVANYIAKMVGVSEGAVESTDTDFRFVVDTTEPGDHVWLMGGVRPNPIMADSFQSLLAVGGAPSSVAPAEVAAMTWGLYNDPQANLLGGWSYHAGSLEFIQWNTMSEVRQQERLDSWDSRGAGDLWGFTSSLIDPLNALSRVGLTRCNESELPAGLDEKAAHVIAAVADQARPAVELGLRQLADGEETSDPRLLWLEPSRTLAIAVWFDALKPMVTSLEVCALPDGAEFLVCFRRHPFRPQYRVVGVGAPGGLMTSDAVRAFLPSPLPNALALWGNPEATPDEVPEILRQRIMEAASASGQDLLVEGAWVAATMGHPWDLVTRGSVVADSVRTAAKALAADDPGLTDPFARWWTEVSRYENVMANFNCLPDAWDGAINSQRAYGGFDSHAFGPLVLTYTTAGLEGSGDDKQRRRS